MLFKCDKCHHIENTACCNYKLREEGDPKLCAECDPAIGKHHNRFIKHKCIGYHLGSDGHAYQVASLLPPGVILIGAYTKGGEVTDSTRSLKRGRKCQNFN